MRRGSYLLCARVDEDCADEAIRILDASDSVDLDERSFGAALFPFPTPSRSSVRKRGSSAAPCWIPAFTGMTKGLCRPRPRGAAAAVESRRERRDPSNLIRLTPA